MTYQNNRPYFNLEYQGDFDNLIKACPASAIRYDSQEYDIEELIEKIKADEVFFRMVEVSLSQVENLLCKERS